MKDCWENLRGRSLENRLDEKLLKWFGYMPWGGAIGWYFEVSSFCGGWYQVEISGNWSWRVSQHYFMFWSRRHWNVVGERWIHPCLPDLAQHGISFSIAGRSRGSWHRIPTLVGLMAVHCWDWCMQPSWPGSDPFLEERFAAFWKRRAELILSLFHVLSHLLGVFFWEEGMQKMRGWKIRVDIKGHNRHTVILGLWNTGHLRLIEL